MTKFNLPSVHIKTTDNTISFNNTWKQTLDNIEIFDSVFVDQNIYSGYTVDKEHKQNLPTIIMGEVGVSIIKRIETIEKSLPEQKQKLDEEWKALVKRYPCLDTSNIADFVLTSQNIEDSVLEAEIQKQTNKINGIQNIDILKNQPLLSQLPIFEINFGSLKDFLEKTVENISKDAEQNVRQHLRKYPMMTIKWLEEGKSLLKNDNLCPFCGVDLSISALISSYKDYFNDAFKEHKAFIENFSPCSRLYKESSKEEFAKIFSDNQDAKSKWDPYVNIVLSSEDDILEIEKLMDDLRGAVENLCQQKKDDLLSNIYNAEKFENLRKIYC